MFRKWNNKIDRSDFGWVYDTEYGIKLITDLFETDFAIESYKQAKNLPAFYLGVVLFGPVFEKTIQDATPFSPEIWLTS